jgi:hypothetical protein
MGIKCRTGYRLLLLVLRCGAQKFDHSDFFPPHANRGGSRLSLEMPHPLRRRRGANALSDRVSLPAKDQGSRGKAKRTTKRSSGKSRLILSGGRHSLPRDQIGVEATPTFALRQREAYLSFLRCSFSRISYRGRALPSYMKVIGLGPRM